MSQPTNMSSDFPGIFISYAREDDEPFAKRLWQDLEENGFSVWWDRAAMESRGRTFLREIRDAIAGAARILLIVGPRVKHSPYVEMEWRHALREGVVVTPLLRSGGFEDVPAALRSLHCEDVRSSLPETEALEKIRRIVSTPVPSLGALVGVPRLPTPYLERPDRLDHLRSRVLIDSYKPIDLQPDQRITSVTGMGGVGKSVLATALAQAPDVRRSFQDGIYWIAVGRDSAALRTLTRVGLALDDTAVDRYTGLTEARLLLGKTLAGKNCLLVLDDIWDVAVAEALHTAAGKNVRILLTSRKRNLFASAGVHEVPVDELSEDEALNLLAEWTKTPRDKLPPEAQEIANECGRLPLALAMIGATIRSRPDRWRHALERLRQADLSKIKRKLPDYEYETLDRAMLVSFQDLCKKRQRRYLDLVAVPEDAAAPYAMLRTWWTFEGMNALDVDDVLDDLVDRSLLHEDERRAFTLHDVQRDFLVMRTQNERVLHSRWLAAFEPRPPEGWTAAEDDGYLFDHLGHHLRSAGREDEWRGLLASFGWLEKKTRMRGFPAVLMDLAAYTQDGVIGPLHRAGRRAAHILTNDPLQLAAQLLARIHAAHALGPLLDGAKTWRGRPWLRPVTPSLGEAGEPTLAVFRGREKDGHNRTPRCIAISADGSLIASGGSGLTVKLWSAEAGILLRSYAQTIDAGDAAALAFVTPHSRLAAANRFGVVLYALDADEPIARYTFEESSVSSICGGGRDNVVFVGFDDGRVLAWDASTDKTVMLREPEGDGVLALARASASPRLAIATASVVECRGDDDGRLIGRIADTAGGGRFHFQPPLLVISPDGTRMFFGSPVRSWTVGDRAAGALMESIEASQVVGLTEDGTVALRAKGDRELVAIDVTTGRRIGRIRNSREISCLAFAPDGRVAASGDFEHDIKLWDLSRGDVQPSAWERRGRVRSVAICDDAGFAFVSSKAGQEMWDTVSGAPLAAQDTPASDRMVRREMPLPETRIEKQVRGRLEQALGVTKGENNYGLEVPVSELAVSLAAGRAVSAPGYLAKFSDMEETPYDPADIGRDYPLQVWNLENTRELRRLHGHTMAISCVDMTADGTRALTGSHGRLLRLWNLDTGACLHVLRGHRGIVFACAISDDARMAVSGSEDMTVRLWDLVQGKLLFTFAASSAVTACDIARDGTVAIAAEVSGRVHTFAVDGLPRP
jgi:WD40 repeat protein